MEDRNLFTGNHLSNDIYYTSHFIKKFRIKEAQKSIIKTSLALGKSIWVQSIGSSLINCVNITQLSLLVINGGSQIYLRVIARIK